MFSGDLYSLIIELMLEIEKLGQFHRTACTGLTQVSQMCLKALFVKCKRCLTCLGTMKLKFHSISQTTYMEYQHALAFGQNIRAISFKSITA